jgi:hypothetical protein
VSNNGQEQGAVELDSGQTVSGEVGLAANDVSRVQVMASGRTDYLIFRSHDTTSRETT